MTAVPSRRTSTLSPSNRNSFGRRTAWLLPVRNTLARLDDMIHIMIRIIFAVNPRGRWSPVGYAAWARPTPDRPDLSDTPDHGARFGVDRRPPARARRAHGSRLRILCARGCHGGE